MTDDLPHLMLYLAGIISRDYKDNRCIISNNFDITRKRLVSGKIDYDSIVNSTNKAKSLK